MLETAQVILAANGYLYVR